MSERTNTTETVPNTPRRWVRRLRIATSVLFGIVTVALCLLWVRSCYARDEFVVSGKSGTRTTIATDRGGILLMRLSNMRNWDGWKYRSTNPSPLPPKYNWEYTQDRKWLVAPIWGFCIAAFAIAFASVAPWQRAASYSVRTMLIATTLVAVVLGLGVWLGR